MLLKKYFLEQLEREGVASRKAIEKVPEGQNGWKPHAKSMELGLLAALVAAMPGWIATMIESDELDLDGKGKSLRTKPVESRARASWTRGSMEVSSAESVAGRQPVGSM